MSSSSSDESINHFDFMSSGGESSDYHVDFASDVHRLSINDPSMTVFSWEEDHEYIQSMTDEEWERLGHYISQSSYLTHFCLSETAINDQQMRALFRGLTRSNSIKIIDMAHNSFGSDGIRSMVPFLQNPNNLTEINLYNNHIDSDGFNWFFRSLRDSPIEELICGCCGDLASIEIDNTCIPRYLKSLSLSECCINTNGCREVAKLLQKENSTLEELWLDFNKIDDEGVAILVNALQNNTCLQRLDLCHNDNISMDGMRLGVSLVLDISDIKSTLKSNHTLGTFLLQSHFTNNVGIANIEEKLQMQQQLDHILQINERNIPPEEAGREKVIHYLLNSKKRAELCRILGMMEHSSAAVYSQIDPLHLPEVLALIGRTHGLGELYVASLSTIVALFSTVDRKRCLKEKLAYHLAKVDEIQAELASIDEEEGSDVDSGGIDHRGGKRPRMVE